MPKIDAEKMASRVRLVEDAALELFKQRGFHGVGLREIAQRAGVSLGNIYNYFESKDAIFKSVIERLYQDFVAEGEPLATFIKQSHFPEDLEGFGRMVGEMVEAHEDYLTLVYLDLAEFNGKHVRPHYLGLTDRFAAILRDRFDQLRAAKTFPDAVDPAVAFTLIYMQFFNFFIVERLIGAKGHLGLDHEGAIQAISCLFTHGINRQEAADREQEKG